MAHAREPSAAKTRPLRFIFTAVGAVAVLWLLAPTASAECARDRKGEVYCGGGRCLADREGTIWCSRFYQGGAERTREGKVVCGKGACATDSRGRVFCSSEVGGAVLIDSAGHVRCYGRCEPAIATNCEHTPADTAG